MPDLLLPAPLARLRQQRTAPLILELDLTDGLSETRPTDTLSAIMSRNRLVLSAVLDALRRARTDERFTALEARVGGRSIGVAAGQELRRAVRECGDADKETVAWADTYGKF